MNKKTLDELSSNHPLCIHLKKKSKINKTRLSLMQTQNEEVQKLGFKNWHFFLQSIKNNFDDNFKNHSFNPDNPQTGLNPLLKDYIFHLGKSLDYGIDFFANHSHLRDRFLILHSKDFNHLYISKSIEQICSRSTSYSIFYFSGDTSLDTHLTTISEKFNYNIIKLNDSQSSHYLKIPFSISIIDSLFSNFSDFHKSFIINIFRNQPELHMEYFDFDFLISYFKTFTIDDMIDRNNINDLLFNDLKNNILEVFLNLNTLSFFDKNKPELIWNNFLLMQSNFFIISNKNAVSILDILFNHISGTLLGVNINDGKFFEQKSLPSLAILTYNMVSFPEKTYLYSKLRGLSTISLTFFDLDFYQQKISNHDSILGNHNQYILASDKVDFNRTIMKDFNFNKYPLAWLNHPYSFFIASSRFNFKNMQGNFIHSFNLCNIHSTNF